MSQQHPRQKRDSSRQLQRRLYRAAKGSKNRRFHALYDRIARPDILWRAWEEVKANQGSAGVDGVSISDVERQGVESFLDRIASELKTGEYRPKPALRVYIPKPDGRQRPLGIPTVRDRVVQQACKLVIEPIFEASFRSNSYGFRPQRRAADAIRHVKEALVRGWWVVDADIQDYFDTISHELLMRLLRRRISIGFHFRKRVSIRTRKLAPYAWPSQKSLKAVRGKIRELTKRQQQRVPLTEIVSSLNRVIRGWRNYFRIGNSTKKLQELDRYTRSRLWKTVQARQGMHRSVRADKFEEWHRRSGIEAFYQPGKCGVAPNAAGEGCRKAV